MRKKQIRIGILTGIFLVAVLFFSVVFNRGQAGRTVALDKATLPLVSYVCEGYEVNALHGYKNEMEVATMRDTILPLQKDGKATVILTMTDWIPEEMTYEVLSSDGEECYLTGSLALSGELSQEYSLELSAAFQEVAAEEQLVLKTSLACKGESVHYYMRVTMPTTNATKNCLQFVESLNKQILGQEEVTGLAKALETEAGGDKDGYQHVTLASSEELVTWNGLSPQVKGEMEWEIKETNSVYTAVLLKYEVICQGELNDSEAYEVQEYFRVRNGDGIMYLLNYDRTVNQELTLSNQILESTGINLGVAESEVTYAVNSEGTAVAFVCCRELYVYRQEEDELAKVFSFREEGEEDLRARYDQHQIEVQSVEENGNIVFTVYGYMNRGLHEGCVGAAVYYYNSEKNYVEEVAFLEGTESYATTKETILEFLYYQSDTDMLYYVQSGELYGKKTGSTTGEATLLQENLGGETSVFSKQYGQIAYIDEEGGITVMDLKEETSYQIAAQEGESLYPLGFIGEDFAYGYVREEDVGTLASGEEIHPMYKAEICDQNKTVQKTYEVEGVYVLSADEQDGQLALRRVVKGENGVYEEATEDYIASNEALTKHTIYPESYQGELFGVQMRITFEESIQDTKPKCLEPKEIKKTKVFTVEELTASQEGKYYAYGLGKLAGVYTNANSAVLKAQELYGVATDSRQRILWEQGEVATSYEIAGIETIEKAENETGREACQRVLLEFTGGSAEDLVDMSGCSVEQLCYLINKGHPVMIFTEGDNALLMIGYRQGVAVVLDPDSGQRIELSQSELDIRADAGGRIMLGGI